MQPNALSISSVPMAIAWLAAILMAGVSGLAALCFCWFLLRVGGRDAADKHGISNAVSSRVGGVIVVCYLLFNTAYLGFFSGYTLSSLESATLAYTLLFFLIGLAEDLTGNVSASIRLALMLSCSVGLVTFVTSFHMAQVGIAWVDWPIVHIPGFSILLSVLCLAFLPNAFNTADGANGLVGGIGLIVLGTLGLQMSNDLGTLQASAAVGCAVFLVFNLLTGRFFLGDGGAYAIGALVGCSLVIVVATTDISPWLLLALIFYPAADLLWSMVRRLVARRALSSPDDLHLHNLVFLAARGVLRPEAANSATGLGIVTIFCLIPAVILWSGLLAMDDYFWSYIVSFQWVLFILTWFFMQRLASEKCKVS